MDEQPAYTGPTNRLTAGSRARRVVIALAVAGALAGVPAGVALAGGNDGSASRGGESTGAGAAPARTTNRGDPQRGEGKRGDCPNKDGGAGQDSTQL
jgi:hypothetical protein